MISDDFLPANFTIAKEAKSAIDLLENLTSAASPDNPPVMLIVSWAIIFPKEGDQYENVFLNYLLRNDFDQFRNLVQRVADIDLIFLTNDHYYDRFAGKVIDHTPADGFFLREPRYAWETPPALPSRKPKPKAKQSYASPKGVNDNA